MLVRLVVSHSESVIGLLLQHTGRQTDRQTDGQPTLWQAALLFNY